jgi:hypothetical protein
MGTSYPTGLDTYTDRSDGQVVYASHVDDLQDAVEAIEIKIGINSSAVAASIDYLLKNAASIDPGHLHTSAGISGQISVAKGGTGLGTIADKAILYASALDTISALAIGTDGQVLTVSSGVPAWTAAGGGITESDTDLAFTGTPTAEYMRFGYGPGATITKDYIVLDNAGDPYEQDMVVLGVDHSAASYSFGYINISGRNQTNATVQGTYGLIGTSSGFNTLQLTGGDFWVAAGDVLATKYKSANGVFLLGYNKGGGPATGSAHVYSSFAGGDVALGQGTLGDTIFCLDNIKFKSLSGITASTTQSQGQGVLVADNNVIATVANTGDTVTLIAAEQGMVQFITNAGANTMDIWPAPGDDLGLGVDTKTTLAAGAKALFVAQDTTTWSQFI